MPIDPPAANAPPELADLDPSFDMTTFAREVGGAAEAGQAHQRRPIPVDELLESGYVPEDPPRRARVSDSAIQLAVAGLLAIGAIAIVLLAMRARPAARPDEPAQARVVVPQSTAPALEPGVRGTAASPPVSPRANAVRRAAAKPEAAAPRRVHARPPRPDARVPSSVETSARVGTGDAAPAAARREPAPVLAPAVVNVNAVPWANVWLDGRSLGETPLANVQVTPGTHEIVFRHPELGERRIRATVESGVPARIVADLRR